MGALGAFALAALLALWLWNPANEGPFPPCPLYWLTGLQCAGCGVLRATHQLMHGDVKAAWALNPLWVVALASSPLAVFAWAKGAKLTKPVPVAVIIVVLVGFTVARNLL